MFVGCEVVEDTPLSRIALLSVVFMGCLNMLSSVVCCEVFEDAPLCGIAILSAVILCFGCLF